ncbi:MAG: pyridoxamine 5'-phosphate oxidase family protein [Fastidiosipilaceae bacterium]|jgi:nitroimidazol reductase NimA-like FMN-containing flavoprotein (pyridoxamine 5'-phosphate oxidase superfamily)
MVFRGMRRKNQALPQQEIKAILYKGTSGVLALMGDHEYPYAVPISYVYDGEKIYFHSAKTGHKLDAIQKYKKASFCVIDKDWVVPEEYTTYFRSAIVFGQIQIMKDETEKRRAIEKLADKYAPEHAVADRDAAICREWNSLCMLEMTIDHVTGKSAIELVQEK